MTTVVKWKLLKGASTLQQLLFYDYLSNSPTQVDTIYLDIRKTFDTVSHCMLLNLGVRELCWNNFGNNDGVKESRIIPEF